MTKQEAIEMLQEINILYADDRILAKIINAAVDIDNEVNNLYLVDMVYERDIYSADDSIVGDIITQELNSGGLYRLYHLLGDWAPASDLVRINAYGNFSPVWSTDLQDLVDEMIEYIEENEDLFEEESDEDEEME